MCVLQLFSIWVDWEEEEEHCAEKTFLLVYWLENQTIKMSTLNEWKLYLVSKIYNKLHSSEALIELFHCHAWIKVGHVNAKRTFLLSCWRTLSNSDEWDVIMYLL